MTLDLDLGFRGNVVALDEKLRRLFGVPDNGGFNFMKDERDCQWEDIPMGMKAYMVDTLQTVIDEHPEITYVRLRAGETLLLDYTAEENLL